MKKDSAFYTFAFALVVCVVCSATLAAVSESLRPRKERNRANDIRKNILKVLQIEKPLPANAGPDEVLSVFRQKVEEAAVDGQGRVVPGKRPGEGPDGGAFSPLYIYREGGAVVAYAFPVEGRGLWSTLYGYLAVEADAETVRGITFYQHGETPGLGGEIEKAWFQNNFRGKKFWDGARRAFRPVTVAKGRVPGTIPADERIFFVDGISGATMTSRGVTGLFSRWLAGYEPFLKNARGGQP